MEAKNRKTFNKLVRDKIPEILQKSGGNPEFEILNNEEYIKKLKEKLFEEYNEVIRAENKADIKEELADLLEVMINFAKVNEISFEEIEKTRILKKEKRGGFDSKILLKSTLILKNI